MINRYRKRMTHKVLVLGVTGMLGHVLFKYLHKDHQIEVQGTARSSEDIKKWFEEEGFSKIKLITKYNINMRGTFIKRKWFGLKI